MYPCSAEAIFLCCSNFHPLLCLLSTLSSLISLCSDNYHVNPEPELPDHPEAWEWWSLSQLSHSGSRYSGKLQRSTYTRWRHVLVTLEFLPSRTDLRGQRWSSVSTCTQHITRYVDLDDHSPSGAPWSFIISLVTLIYLSSSYSSTWNALCWFTHSLSAVSLVICSLAAGQCSVRTDLLAHFTPFMFKIAAVFSSLTFNWRQNVPVMRIFITSTLLSLGQGSQENFLMSAETN